MWGIVLVAGMGSFAGDDVQADDGFRFGVSPERARDGWHFAMAHCKWAKDERYIRDRRWDDYTALAEWHHRVWFLLDDAVCWDYRRDQLGGEPLPWYQAKRIQSLKELRAMIGEEAWQRGEIPDPAPFHLFASMDKR